MSYEIVNVVDLRCMKLNDAYGERILLSYITLSQMNYSGTTYIGTRM